MVEIIKAPKRDAKSQQILIYSENVEIIRMQRDMLKSFGARNIIAASNPSEMMEYASVSSIGTILVNANSRVDPRKIISALRDDQKVHDPFAQVFFVTGSSSAQVIKMVILSGYDGILRVPFSRARLWKTIERMSETQREFVRVGEYFGPDRRKGLPSMTPDTEERRKEDLLRKTGMSKNQAS